MCSVLVLEAVMDRKSLKVVLALRTTVPLGMGRSAAAERLERVLMALVSLRTGAVLPEVKVE
jgi:hypothetical protein